MPPPSIYTLFLMFTFDVLHRFLIRLFNCSLTLNNGLDVDFGLFLMFTLDVSVIVTIVCLIAFLILFLIPESLFCNETLDFDQILVG